MNKNVYFGDSSFVLQHHNTKAFSMLISVHWSYAVPVIIQNNKIQKLFQFLIKKWVNSIKQIFIFPVNKLQSNEYGTTDAK